MNLFIVLFALLDAAVFLIYVADSNKRRRITALTPLAASLVTMLAVALLLGTPPGEVSLFFVLGFAVLFSILPFYYIKSSAKLTCFLVLIVIEFFYTTLTYGSVLYSFIQALAIGTAWGVVHRSGLGILGGEHKRASKKVETERDIVHMLLGVVVLGAFLALKFYYAVYVATALIFLGYIYNSVLGNAKKGVLYEALNSLERPDALYGLGALYLGVGVALLLGFIHNLHFVIIGLAALLFADPMATIIGLNFNGPRLFYNKKKSLYGTIAFFATVAIIGYPFIGAYSLLFGLGLAIVESIKSPIDDNIAISVIMILLYVVFLALMNALPF